MEKINIKKAMERITEEITARILAGEAEIRVDYDSPLSRGDSLHVRFNLDGEEVAMVFNTGWHSISGLTPRPRFTEEQAASIYPVIAAAIERDDTARKIRELEDQLETLKKGGRK